MKINILILTIFTIIFSGPVLAGKSQIKTLADELSKLDEKIEAINSKIYGYEKLFQSSLSGIKAKAQKSETPSIYLQMAKTLQESRIQYLTTEGEKRNSLIEQKKKIEARLGAEGRVKDEVVALMDQMFAKSKNISMQLAGTNAIFTGEFDASSLEEVDSSEPKDLLGGGDQNKSSGIFRKAWNGVKSGFSRLGSKKKYTPNGGNAME